ncbi:TfoX/Sxy family protein [Nocardia shimofusensis]|uniref:TfoX/Sxy family protein n=1 Tax=Nocardia shimofusensis TaxID=228596 RepID=UPI000831FFFB|nr:TfoX/Sxy family protein [Nocardia shimofusensis]
MAYDTELAERVRELLATAADVSEKHMFGGLAFLIGGNMAVAASHDGGLLVRVDPEDGDRLVDDDRVRPMVMRGREMSGWLKVAAEAVVPAARLRDWVHRGVAYARTLPVK